MVHRIQEDVVQKLFTVEIARESTASLADLEGQKRAQQVMLSRGGEAIEAEQPVAKRHNDKIGRNDPCPCGSGRKYKRCCGK
jgi:preprotein translocase subunit SecA